jgi:hypothetical protein
LYIYTYYMLESTTSITLLGIVTISMTGIVPHGLQP